MNDIRPQLPKRAQKSEKKTRQIPAMPFANAHRLDPCRVEIRLHRTGIEMHHRKAKLAPLSQGTCKRYQLPLSPAVTEVTDQKGKSAWHWAFGHSVEL